MKRFKIESHIPVTGLGKWSKLARKMKRGESILFKGRIDANKLRLALYNVGSKAVIRNVPNTNKFRVWRINK